MRLIKSAGLTIFLSVLSNPTFANVDPKIAEFCLKAQDFQGCVKSMSGDSSGTTTTIRQIQQKGADIAEGNQCPSGHAYIGGGNCQSVMCGGSAPYGNDPRLANKGWECGKRLGIFGANLILEGPLVRASFNSACPGGEPEIGFNSTCSGVSRAIENWEIDEGNKGCYFNSECSFDKWRERKEK